MDQKLKYTWDIVLEKNLTTTQLVAVNEISKIISCGGDVKRIKHQLQKIGK